MKKLLLVFVGIIILGSFGIFINIKTNAISGAPPYGEAENEIPQNLDPYSWILDWKRPDGPTKVALQVGHWKNEEVPEELERLKGNTGSSGGGKWEWEVNMQIALETQKLLESEGILVEILPTTIPESYWADVFIAIHADGSTDRTKSGYKIASPWRDFTHKSHELVNELEKSYELHTKLLKDPNITRNMHGYYAFSFWRYKHAIHPMTTAAIVETGFLTNTSDQKLLINRPEVAASGIANGILAFLEKENLANSFTQQ